LNKRIVVAASGSGSNFQALINAQKKGILQASIIGLIAGRPGIGAITRAEAEGIPVAIIPPETAASATAAPPFAQQLLQILQHWKPDLLVLAGFLRKIPDEVIRAYPDRIVNIHPSLLPRYGGKGFYGMRVHQAVLEAGETQSGCSVHLVDGQYDHGRLLAQTVVPVFPQDEPTDLAARVLKEEHTLYPAAIQRYLETLN